MGKNYQHLSSEERAVIQIERGRGASCRVIAKLLGRSPSTIAREVGRAPVRPGAGYDATLAAHSYRVRRSRSVRRNKLVRGTWLYQHVHDRLVYWRWSPQQIAARLRIMFPHEPARQISHETIYAAIYAHPRVP